MSVGIERGVTWRAGIPTKLFEGRYFYVDALGAAGAGRTYDVSPDGQRFLMIKDSGSDGASAALVVVENWFEELKQRVPVK